MQNRFFDIDDNIYLNSLYIISLLYNSSAEISIEKLLIEVYLFKFPKITCELLESVGDFSFNDILYDFQINNLQNHMQKYLFTIHATGFYEALAYLYSKNLLLYKVDFGSVSKTDLFNDINIKQIPDYLLKFASKIVNLIDKSDINLLTEQIKKIERSYYE